MLPRLASRCAALLAFLLCAAPAPGQEPPAAAATGPEPQNHDTLLPRVDVFLPEGDFDFRLSRLIKSALVEGQFRYNFVTGDITAFLRYRYYGLDKTYQISVFDEVAFDRLEQFSNDFSRVRGGLFLLQWPRDYQHRASLLVEGDRITSSRPELQFNTNKTNTYVRLGYQIGTPNDERSNAIVGESRARIQRLFTAYREIGPRGAGFTTGLTYSFDYLSGDFSYVKLEFEGLKRINFPHGFFLIGRVHGGSFLAKQVVREDTLLPDDRYSIPRAELLQLNGRDGLKGVPLRRRGTEEVDTTWELFAPWFVDESRRALGVQWRSWYWVVYAGYGTAGFDRNVYSDFGAYIPDVGFGLEAAFQLKDYTFFFSGIAAEALKNGGGVKVKVSIKSFH